MSRTRIIHYPVGENARMTIKLEPTTKSPRYPTGMRFAAMGFITTEEGEYEIIRIDNTPHRGTARTHIHYFNKKEKVIFHDFKSYSQSCEYIEQYLKERDCD
jgi:hypothetical protein